MSLPDAPNQEGVLSAYAAKSCLTRELQAGNGVASQGKLESLGDVVVLLRLFSNAIQSGQRLGRG